MVKKNNNDNKKSSPEEVRLAALLRSRERTEPLVPILRKLTELELESDKRYYLRAAAALYRDMIRGAVDRGESRRIITPIYEFKRLKELEDLSKGIGLPTTLNGISCLYTATDNYGDKCRVSGNLTFYDNPSKYGFKEVSSDEMLPGDLVQSFINGIPVHSLIFDSYDDSGEPLYNYSKGGEGKDLYVVRGKFPMNQSKVYRYIGFDNEKANGGIINRFNLGGPVGGIVPKGYGQPNFNLTSKINPSKVGIPSGGSGAGSGFLSNLGSNITSFLGSGLGINMLSNAAFGLLNPNGNSTGVGNALLSIGGLASNIPGVGGIAGAAVGAVGGLVNTMFGSNINEENVALFRNLNKQLTNYTSNASTNEELLADFAGISHLANVKRSDVGSDGWFSDKAKNLTKDINAERLRANLAAITSLGNTALTVDTTNDLLKGYNYGAYGGPINMRYTGTMSPFGNLFKDGGIYIKPENRGKFTALKERIGKSATWFKEHGTPALKKMATFALNSRKWRHDDGGPLFIESLPEIIVTPTNDAKFLFSQGIYKRSSRPPLGDKNIRKLVASYLSKYDNENAEEYNKRISRFSDAIYETGILFKTNKKDRAYYSPGTGIAYIKTMDDFFGELAHPYLEVRGTFKPIHELSEENYDNDKDYRGGTRYAYPDTFEGETHGFFEPALYEWITTGKIGKSSPVINKRQSNEKIAPKDIVEVVDSAASWSKLAAIKRIISKPDLLPFLKRIKYKLIDFPLRDSSRNTIYPKEELKEYAFGGELTHGGIFSHGTSSLSNGSTHEENPYDGIQVGVDEQNVPNLVEEGELIWNDYVFSNRLNVPKSVRLKYKLRNTKDLKFAEAAKLMQKESEERPNDPISKNGLDAALSRLAMEQELIRMKKELRLNKYAEGGELGNLYEGTGSKSNFLLFKKRSYPNPFTTPNFSLYAIKDPFKIPLPRYTTPDFSVSLLKPNASSLEGYISDMFEPINFTTNTNSSIKTRKDIELGLIKKFKESPLRYAPIVGHAAGVISDIFSKPDYLAADEVRNIELNPSLVGFTPIGNKLRFTPYDINFQINKANANAGASRRNIMNTSGGNRAAAMAGLMGVDTNYYNALGDVYRLALLYNDARREAVETFNRTTDLYNSEMGLKAAMANAESRNAMAKARYERDKIAALLGQLARDAYNTRRSNNLNILLEDLGNLGRERNNRNWLDILSDKDVLKMDTKGLHVSSDKKEKKNGGKLNRKKKGGFTYA